MTNPPLAKFSRIAAAVTRIKRAREFVVTVIAPDRLHHESGDGAVKAPEDHVFVYLQAKPGLLVRRQGVLGLHGSQCGARAKRGMTGRKGLLGWGQLAARVVDDRPARDRPALLAFYGWR